MICINSSAAVAHLGNLHVTVCHPEMSVATSPTHWIWFHQAQVNPPGWLHRSTSSVVLKSVTQARQQICFLLKYKLFSNLSENEKSKLSDIVP